MMLPCQSVPCVGSRQSGNVVAYPRQQTGDAEDSEDVAVVKVDYKTITSSVQAHSDVRRRVEIFVGVSGVD
jgi:hypothetical protein